MKTITYNCDACGIVIEKNMLTVKQDKNVKHFCETCVSISLVDDLIEGSNAKKVHETQNPKELR